MTNGNTRQGFTLIELLVVVLIIGILAAVALPQYQKAVMKSRVAEYETTMRAIGDAAAICKLQKGSTCTIDELDIDFPDCNLIPGLVDNATICTYTISGNQVKGKFGNTEVFRYYYQPTEVAIGYVTNPDGHSASMKTTSVQGFFCYGQTLCPKIGFSNALSTKSGGEQLYIR